MSGDINRDFNLLMRNAEIGLLENVQKLLAKHPNNPDFVNRTNTAGQTALHLAAKGGWPKVVQALLDAGADINHQDQLGQAPLRQAAARQHLNDAKAVTKILLKHKADIHVDGREALYSAIVRGHLPIVAMLLEAGVALNSKDQYGLTPLLYAAAELQVDIVKAFIAAGADCNVANTLDGGKTPLHYAATHMSDKGIPTMKVLIDAGADSKKVDADNRTPLDYLESTPLAKQQIEDWIAKLPARQASERRWRMAKDVALGFTIVFPVVVGLTYLWRMKISPWLKSFFPKKPAATAPATTQVNADAIAQPVEQALPLSGPSFSYYFESCYGVQYPAAQLKKGIPDEQVRKRLLLG